MYDPSNLLMPLLIENGSSHQSYLCRVELSLPIGQKPTVGCENVSQMSLILASGSDRPAVCDLPCFLYLYLNFYSSSCPCTIIPAVAMSVVLNAAVGMRNARLCAQK